MKSQTVVSALGCLNKLYGKSNAPIFTFEKAVFMYILCLKDTKYVKNLQGSSQQQEEIQLGE
jgi:hypothetical protein